MPGLKREASVDVVDCEFMPEEMVDDVAEKSSFADACLTHNHYWDVETHSLDHQAHLEEVVDVYDIALFAVDLVESVS